MKWVAALPTGPTRSTAPPTAATLGPIPTPVPPSLAPAVALRASSPRCTPVPLTGGHGGWGEPAAYNHVVSYVYAARNTGTGDPGDVFYIRSTDSGVTFSAPFQLNTNVETTKAQWMPNLSVSEAGTLFATWYDEAPRTSASCQPSSPTNLCYQMHSRKSPDNGMTWGPTKRPRMSSVRCRCKAIRASSQPMWVTIITARRYSPSTSLRGWTGVTPSTTHRNRMPTPIETRWVQHLRPVHPRRRLRQLVRRRQLQQRQRLARQTIRQLLPLAP